MGWIKRSLFAKLLVGMLIASIIPFFVSNLISYQFNIKSVKRQIIDLNSHSMEIGMDSIKRYLAVYNDFMLPLIMISSNELRTLPLAVSVFFGNYANDWNLIMASLSISILPIIFFFLFMQRYIVQGLVAGAVKG